jgi:hypothetical protein
MATQKLSAAKGDLDSALSRPVVDDDASVTRENMSGLKSGLIELDATAARHSEHRPLSAYRLASSKVTCLQACGSNSTPLFRPSGPYHSR